MRRIIRVRRTTKLAIALVGCFVIGLGLATLPLTQRSSAITPNPVRIGGGITPVAQIGTPGQAIKPNAIAPAPAQPIIASPTVTPAPSVPTGVVEQLNQYSIQGQTAEELANQMKRLGFQEPNSQPLPFQPRFYGGTLYTSVPELMPQQQGDRCSAGESRLTTTITQTMPLWTDKAIASPELQASWDKFYAALKAHEDHHRDLGVQMHREIRQILNTTTAPDCQTLVALVNQQIGQLTQRHAQLNAEYDRTTNHGMNQGAVFPPA